jgi:hypothetical protein
MSVHAGSGDGAIKQIGNKLTDVVKELENKQNFKTNKT